MCIRDSILQSINLLSDVINSFTKNCIKGIEPNNDRIQANLYNSLMLVTALNPHIGYDKAAKVAKKAFEDKSSLKEAIVELGYLSAEDFDVLINPADMIKPSKK